MTILKGDQVFIKPEFQDAGDELYTWIAMGDEYDGKVMIYPSDIELIIAPSQIVKVSMLEDN
tara:strand:+ start:216 stop:401 length:186 start_codon:yes stop_codon:yes gene_type:complete